MEEHQLFLCLGGNQGNKSEIFNTTRKLIAENIGTLRNISPVYASPPWGFKAHSAFWNQVLEVSTSLSPEEVLIQIHKIEAGFGRKRIAGKYLSRKMDIRPWSRYRISSKKCSSYCPIRCWPSAGSCWSHWPISPPTGSIRSPVKASTKCWLKPLTLQKLHGLHPPKLPFREKGNFYICQPW